MTRFALTVTLFATVFAFIGCASDAKSKTAASVMLTEIEPAAEIGYRIAWQTTLAMPRGTSIQEIKPLGDYIVTRESGNVFSLINAETGAIQWRQTIGRATERFQSPVIHDQHLLVCSETRAYFMRLDNGQMANLFTFKRNAATTPIVTSGLLVLGGPSGRMFAMDTEHGHTHWEYQMTGGITNDPVMMAGLMLVTDESGSVAVLNAANGAIVWRRHSPPWDQVTAQPAASESVAYVASKDQKLYAFERTSGSILWEYLNETPLTHGPVVIDEMVLQRTSNRGLLAIDTLTGEELWQSDVTGQIMQRRNDQLVLRDGNVMNTISIDDGKLIASVQLPLARMILAEDIDGGPLYLAHTDGRILRLNPRR